MRIEIRPDAFNPWEELQRVQQTTPELAGQFGATASFVGTLRDFNQNEPVTAMTLEHYPGMTERCLEQIVNEAANQWTFLDTLILHRIGHIRPNDPIVLVVVWSTHRGDAFDACRYMMEALKSKAPFWKQETIPDGKRWVEHNSSGYSPADTPSG